MHVVGFPISGKGFDDAAFRANSANAVTDKIGNIQVSGFVEGKGARILKAGFDCRTSIA